MAYFNPDTFQICADSNIDGYLDDFVEIDEVIAPLIRELNRRGYKTDYCCSGHPLRAYNELFTDAKEADKAFADVLKVEKTDKDRLPYRVITNPLENDFYISFASKRKEDFPYPLPYEFQWDGDSIIRYRYAHEDFYAFLAERLMVTNALHRWVLQLPETE